MFNRNKIKKLRGDLDFLKDVVLSMKNDFDKKVESLETEIWRLKNPPKFKAGDNVSCYLVLESSLMRFVTCDYIKGGYSTESYWQYSVFNNATNKKETKKEEYLVSAKSNFDLSQKAPRKPAKKK